jgi:hypothetical protein
MRALLTCSQAALDSGLVNADEADEADGGVWGNSSLE